MAGRVIAIPTDTLYGLAALPRPGAVDAIFELKTRPRSRLLPVLGASMEDLETVVTFGPDSLKLARAFWPGALTIVLPRAPGFDQDLGGGTSSTVGVRVPRLDLTRELLKLTGPLVVTSANPSDEPPATTAAEVTRYFGSGFPVLDGGPAAGKPSTTVAVEGGLKVLRAGAIGEEELRQSLMS
jgi:tRNA threonylcarbamoyl adenosine modification protein (Sua5/YciO/YrdC/YwlC family)